MSMKYLSGLHSVTPTDFDMNDIAEFLWTRLSGKDK
jgi:hypothetical protein